MAIACCLKIVPNDNVAIFCGRKDSANKILSRIIKLEHRGYDVSGLKYRSDSAEIEKNLIFLQSIMVKTVFYIKPPN